MWGSRRCGTVREEWKSKEEGDIDEEDFDFNR